MRLTKLELHGFKSFADATQLLFEPGATMIVGPNGCGKSNVSDAVRWVLGEQRARALRGAKMEEVIFQGSSARRAVNVAEVSLHFDNEDGTLPLPFREVVITRRLSRSGESEYFLNRAPCRLRDVQDLVRGTGLGADSGVVIESRMIDALLSDRPDDRRELFEEAAGVGLYRDRRRSTERRLEETTVDLARLDDLINEVTSQVRSLARQRKRAERYTELMKRRFSVELTLAAREMEAWRDELARLEVRVAELRERSPDVHDAVDEAERAREGAAASRSAAEAQRSELARIVASQRQGVLQLQGEMAVAEERQRNALSRRQRAEQERQEGEQLGVRVAAERAQAVEERAQLEQVMRAAAEQLQERVGAEEEARGAVAAARAAVEQADRRSRELRDQIRRLELDREGAGRELADVATRADALEEERATLADNLDAIVREAADADDALAAAREQVSASAAALEAARTAARQARERDAAARAELFRVDEAHTALRGKVSALEQLERERVGLAPAAARLLKERATFAEGAIVGPLSDFISADAASALVVERFLGNTVHAILVRDVDAADAVRRWHAAANPGPLLLLPLDAMPEDEEPFGPPDEGALYELVEAATPARGWVRALLGHATSLDGGTAFLDARGALFLPGTGGGPGPLQRRAELTALRAELARSAEARAVASAAADAVRAALEGAEHDAAQAGEAATEAQRVARRAEEHRGELQRRRERAERELAQARGLAEKLAERREELSRRAAALDEQVEGVRVTLASREAETAEARARMQAAEEAQEEARERRTVCQVEQAQAQARLQVAADRERRLAQEAEKAAARIDTLHRELSTLAEADTALAGQMGAWQIDLETRNASLADAEGRLADAEAALRTAETALVAADQTLAETRRRAGALGEELHHAELRYTDLSGRRTAIRGRLETEWRRPLEDLLAELVPLELADEPLREEAEELRGELDAMGPVNQLAIEEHEEELKRLDFLTTQRSDLAEAKLSLQQAIREIDTTARELFIATFAQVRENFRQIFMTLFGGGECDLKLENPEAPLDCDIEIHASPRGKRTQRIHLLSSGERNLVALSLLFGIFLTKPSPFCLLDEVDAPLDDQNVGRYVRMLNQFKQQTQFIVITHNPRTTTEAADAVYGVTMQEPGVSSLVSVRMRGAAVEEAIAGIAGGAGRNGGSAASAAVEPVGAGA
ncbi:MAG TPA: chromosome segregation protein SMC [Gemmatimonadaceae bacterium]|nr:chromosome segregation protein SMC [Gemmatimonadaceae bacterium]